MPYIIFILKKLIYENVVSKLSLFNQIYNYTYIFSWAMATKFYQLSFIYYENVIIYGNIIRKLKVFV
jgi:hypothetical protein